MNEFEAMVLAVHNRERAAFGVPPLTLSDTLAAHAKEYADYLAATGKVGHVNAGWHAILLMEGEHENLAHRQGIFPATVPMAQLLHHLTT